MKTQTRALSVLLPAVSAIGGVLIFAATIFAYANAHATKTPGSYVPLFLGASSFVVLVGAVTYAASLNGGGRLWKSVLASVVAGACFVLSVLFVLINAFGS